MSIVVLPPGMSEEQQKLAQCRPDKYVVAVSPDVVLTPDEWLAFADYTVVMDPYMPKGQVYLLRKVEMS